ncbi:hypothetical protein ASD65_09600 [Microbacterium sp. Root61]|uniref:hypothetical protein n=1 Tax=Microbacterium sp. Root61 TaxID=1736570 RepID=UPI0006F60EBD|nr:hypothetical protein [Microbacterium sp. Root61]KRA24634.1 hypothetical protein ASD65_09600 [Microbacterium sp. Root61]
MTSKRFVALAGVIALAGVLVACGPTPMPYDDAAAHYDAAMTDVVGALEAAYPDVSWATDGATRASTSTGECRLHVATQESEPSLLGAAGGWDAVWSTVNPALQEHGFATIDSEDDVPGGWTASTSRDDGGAVLQILDKGLTKITLSAPLAPSACNSG